MQGVSDLGFRGGGRDADLAAEDAGLREEPAKYHKKRLEPRVTRVARVGRFLRRTSLDGLPLVWNVLRGNRHA